MKLTTGQLKGLLAIVGSNLIQKAVVDLIGKHIESLDGENAQYRKEIDRLRSLVDEKARDEKRAVAAADRLQDNVVKLQAECRRLEAEVDAAREAKKVALPRKVAEALDFFRNEGACADDIMRRVEYQADGKCIDAIRGHIRDGKGYDVAHALVNGYTVEEPPTAEERIFSNLKQAIEEMQVKCSVPVERLAKVLTLAVRESLAEDRQQESKN